MFFTQKELTAIVKVAFAMANADGRVTIEEQTMIALELVRFDVQQEQLEKILKDAGSMTGSEANVIISSMTAQEKKYVTAFLGIIICSDGKIEDSELKMWSLISLLCDLPTMTLSDAIDIMRNL